MDDEGEVRQGVQDVMNRIDRHSDGSLSRSDFNEYLLGMELTMGVEQTRDWVKYAVQLPDRIADTFRENHVTGAEFMEVSTNASSGCLVLCYDFERRVFQDCIFSLPYSPPTFFTHFSLFSAAD